MESDLLNVLSLFDGKSGGQIALDRLKIKYNTYYASEINPHSIKVTQKNYPNTIQLGDVRNIDFHRFKHINLLLGGTPCTDLSIVAVDRKDITKGLEGKNSSLFYEYVKALNIINPKYFLVENVASMTEENKEIISKELGVKSIMINSSIFSAQEREREYWTNIPLDDNLPKDKGLVLKDIMEENVDEKYYYDKPFEFYGLDKNICGKLLVNSHDMCKRIYNPNFKCATLTAVRGGYQEKKVYDNGRVRKLTPVEYERLQTIPDGYTYGVSDTARRSMCGDGWTIDVICWLLKNINKK